ncbi:PAS domain-containing protein [Thetidibacter halocola]|uniref:PAS domain-containing protein n=1 Tax=Thetidibacter halocola TaxID=2827239 RepID=A0A8J7WEE2_9RHOB|nr:PAS domain-containing protein [Thetidibacter halocola]MBS0126082.1 PAS domain-containing protein [Thetidibacter halocola]
MSELNPHFAKEASHSTISSGEAAFQPSEMFYSRTDKRGVIIEANSVFRRVSGFLWEEIKGAPHKIIRHPDMPKGVFQLYWDRLKADKPVVAYVKNRTKEGRYYWVLALTWPMADGFMSVRIKPTTDLFRKVQGIYAALLADEKQGLTPAQSAERLKAMLKQAGFRSYDSFMTEALSRESAARTEQRGLPVHQVQRRFSEMFETVCRLGEETDQMTEIIHAIRTVPMNMRILASRLENAGGPISAISVNYGSMLDEMATWVREFVEGEDSTYARIHDAIQHGQFLVCAAAIQREMSDRFEEDLAGAADTEQLESDRRMLRSEAQKFETDMRAALKTVETEVNRLSRSVLDMKRYVTGLSSTRMMCKIESAALYGSGDTSLSGIVDQLDAGQNEIEERLARIVQLNSVIQGHTGMIRTMA